LANLLSHKPIRDPFQAFDDHQRARFQERARSLWRTDWPGLAGELARAVESFVDDLEELESEPSLIAADDLLDRINRVRQPILSASPRRRAVTPGAPGGEWLCYWPGRSLSTGEAEIASRGFFDVRDRPPVGLWVEAIERRRDRSSAANELAIVCWIPPEAVQRARAGREACTAGSLAYLAEVSDALSEQIRETLVAGVQGNPTGRSSGGPA